jgi:hypothetical protein
MLNRVGDFFAGLEHRWAGLETFGPGWDNALQCWRSLDRAGAALDWVEDIWTDYGQRWKGWRPWYRAETSLGRVGDIWTDSGQRCAGLENFGDLWTWLGQRWAGLETFGDLWTGLGQR